MIGGNGGASRFFPAPALARAVAREIAELLAEAARGGPGGAIDLRSLPLGPGDVAELQDLLGTGEVEATLQINGRSAIRETGHAGVWWVQHFDSTDQPQSEQIVVAPVPDILCADRSDMARAAAALASALATDAPAPTPPHEGHDHGSA
jgi:hydrogenase-1 operon protein HyaF